MGGDSMPEGLSTIDIPNVELFSVGTWRGDSYSHEDLDEMVRAANEVPGLRRPVRLGHTEGLGLPAVGWVENLRREGDKLFGDLLKVPKKLGDLITSGAYRKRSAEVYWDYTDGRTGRTYPRVFRALALLGADIPAVNNLEDIVALYAEHPGASAHEVHRYYTEVSGDGGPATYDDDSYQEDTSEEDDLMKDKLYDILGIDEAVSEDEALAMVSGLASVSHEYAESVTTEAIRAYQESEEFRTLKADAEAGRAAAQKLYQMERDSVIKAAVTEGRLLPADVEKWTKRYDDAPEMTSEILAELPKVVEFGELGDSSMREQRGDIVAEIHAYMAEKGIGYEDAALAVLQQRGEV